MTVHPDIWAKVAIMYVIVALGLCGGVIAVWGV